MAGSSAIATWSSMRRVRSRSVAPEAAALAVTAEVVPAAARAAEVAGAADRGIAERAGALRGVQRVGGHGKEAPRCFLEQAQLRRLRLVVLERHEPILLG